VSGVIWGKKGIGDKEVGKGFRGQDCKENRSAFEKLPEGKDIFLLRATPNLNERILIGCHELLARGLLNV
jgi:hypothetical protein